MVYPDTVNRAALPLADLGDDELAEIGTILSMWRPFRIDVYKDKCMKRRIAMRMRSARCNSVSEYCNLLRQSPGELDLLLKALTIHVSQFFRNPTMFEKLRQEILPLLYRRSLEQGKENLRFWCLGCATGEEPYSLALVLRQHFLREIKAIRTAIDGTDIDLDTISAAILADYDEDRIKEVPPDLVTHFFRMSGHRYQLVPEIRKMVTFSQGDITRTGDYRPSDLVLCRNTLIYFTRIDQEKILHGIADILPTDGILVLGKSETLTGDVRRRFGTFCPIERIYYKL